MKEKEIERRSVTLEMRARQDEQTKQYIIEGRPIVYDVVTDLGGFMKLSKKGR